MSEPKSGDLFFTYGTLKAGGKYHHLLEKNDKLGTGTMQVPYPLVLAEYPCLLDQPGQGHHVRGEVYRITDEKCWEELDELEDHPIEFKRRRELIDLDGHTLQAWTYFYQLVDQLPDSVEPIEEFPAD
jgi:gamma-glutamylcyclotransferase (GGCT)/AIG2-like uncharacterized protein YtfP